MDRYSHYVTQAMAELRQWGYRPGLSARNEAIHQLETAGGEQL